jgi:hypothetical protein
MGNFVVVLFPKYKMVKSWTMRCAGHVACTGEKRNAYRVLVRKPEGKRSLGRLKAQVEVNIKMDLREAAWGDIYIGLIWLGIGTRMGLRVL